LNLFNYMYSALLILYVTNYLNIRPAVLGVGLGLASVGALIGAALAQRLADRSASVRRSSLATSSSRPRSS
jgi:hypothetical protein